MFLRPVPGWARYRMPINKLYLCSGSTHPGGGVMCISGRNAAQKILKDFKSGRL
jgi:phytoene dehydrogenase-like protein